MLRKVCCKLIYFYRQLQEPNLSKNIIGIKLSFQTLAPLAGISSSRIVTNRIATYVPQMITDLMTKKITLVAGQYRREGYE